MYNASNRYRCTIIRGKAQSQIEDLVPVYAGIIINCEGFSKKHFKKVFDEELSKHISSPTSKTLANHRTEITEQLFGMYYFVNDKLVVSDRTLLVAENGDLPRFFKSIVWKFQFPNGMDATQTIKDKLNNGIKLRPFHFIISLLSLAEEHRVELTKNELAYYALDSLNVLQGVATPKEVLSVILADRESEILNKVEYPGKGSSYNMQHITEQLNLLELSNVIEQRSEGHDKIVSINHQEDTFIMKMLEEDYSSPEFNIYQYFTSGNIDSKTLSAKWSEYFCAQPINFEITQTKPFVLTQVGSKPVSDSPLDIGDEGERIVFEKEKERVKIFNSRLAQNKVLLLGKQKGLGYDIQSVWAGWKDKFHKEADESFYIEVKSTRRITPPTEGASDNIVLTRNEWLAANQHQECFSIFRVYLTRSGVFTYKIFNPLNNDSSFCAPIKYNYEFSIEQGLEEWA